MQLLRLFQLGVKNLLLHKLRSALTALGVLLGVASVIAALSAAEGAKQQQLRQIREMGADKIILNSVLPVINESVGRAEGNSLEISYGLTYDDRDRINLQFDSVSRVVGVRKFDKRDVRYSDHVLELSVAGTTPTWFELVQQKVTGRALSWEDESQASGVCVLTKDAARRLLFAEHAMEETITIDGDAYTVIGFVERGYLPGRQDQEVDILIPLSTSRARFGETVEIVGSGQRSRERVELHQIVVEVESTAQVMDTYEAIRTMLEYFHEDIDYKIDVPLDQLRAEEATQRLFAILLGSLSAISLVVGGIGIMNIMLATVTERTREIGIRRAIGAKRSQIVAQFLVETIILSVIGGLVGVGAGLALPKLIEWALGFPTSTPAYAIVLSVGISVLVGVLAGLYPAIRASRLDPIVALRHE